MDRLNYYYIFQNYIKRGTDGLLSRLQRKAIRIQKLFRINRTKEAKIQFQKGAQWFSITHSTACYVLSEYNHYKKHFKYTLCGDEEFLQTILINSPHIDRIIDENLRCIDWHRGNPYIFKLDDYNMLMDSDKLFARKFDIRIDRDIIQKIYDSLKEKE